jgi:uncharacterized protein with HEPN domain
MLDHAREAVAMVAGKERVDLQSERMLELALVRLIEIVGEAAGRLSPEGQARYPLIKRCWVKFRTMNFSYIPIETPLTRTSIGFRCLFEG